MLNRSIRTNIYVEEEAVKRMINILFAVVILLGFLWPSAGNAKAEDDNICTIKVWHDGYATIEDGTRVTEVPYGTSVTIWWEIPKNKWIRSYFISQKGEGIEYGIEYFPEKIRYEGLTPEGLERYSLTVELDIASHGPGKYDYAVNATIEEQVPLTIDLTKGILNLDACTGLEQYYGTKELLDELKKAGISVGEPSYGYVNGAYDIDGNGSADLLVRVLIPSYDYEGVDGDLNGTPYLVPAGDCSICGAYTFTPNKNSYYAKYSPITFLFSEEPVKKEYSVSVQNGHAELAGGKTVTVAAPGETVYPVADTLNGQYVDSWKCDAFDASLNRIRQDDYDQAYVPFIMPACDVTWESVVKDQTPVTIDLSKGYWIAPTEANGRVYREDSVYYPRNYRVVKDTDLSEGGYLYGKADLDGDGTLDIAAGYFGVSGPGGWSCNSYFVIPLSGNSIHGEYTISEPNDGPHGPYKIIFPKDPVAEKYRVTVNGGKAFDGNGKRITEAAPGAIVNVELQGHRASDFKSDPEYYFLPEHYFDWGGPSAFLMPACDISYVAEGGENMDGQVRDVTIAFEVSDDGTRWEYHVPYDEDSDIQNAWYSLQETYRDFGIQWNGSVISMSLNTLDEYMVGKADSIKFPYPATVQNVTVTFESFTIVVKGGKAYDDRNYDEVIYSGIPGHRISVAIDRSSNDDIHYAVMESSDVLLEYHKEDVYEFYMPNRSVFVATVLKEGIPLVIDLNKGPYTYEDGMLICIGESLGGNRVLGNMDLNGDGKADIRINTDSKTIEALPEYSCAEEIQGANNNPGPYYPITIRYSSNKGETGITPAPTGEDKPTAAPDGKDDPEPAEKDRLAAKEQKKGKLNPLWIILPVVAVLLAAGGAFLFLRKRKNIDSNIEDADE